MKNNFQINTVYSNLFSKVYYQGEFYFHVAAPGLLLTAMFIWCYNVEYKINDIDDFSFDAVFGFSKIDCQVFLIKCKHLTHACLIFWKY